MYQYVQQGIKNSQLGYRYGIICNPQRLPVCAQWFDSRLIIRKKKRIVVRLAVGGVLSRVSRIALKRCPECGATAVSV